MEEKKTFIENLHKQYYNSLYQYAQRKTGDPFLPEDLVQCTFMIAVRRINDLYESPNPGGWLFKTLHYLFLHEMDLARRKYEIPLTDYDDIVGDDGANIKLEYKLPQGLSESEKRILIWRFEKRYDFATIAELSGAKETACRKQISRALAHCRELMEKEKKKSRNTSYGGYSE